MSDEEENDESGLLESYQGRVFLGDCISFFIEGTKIEAQGAVIKIYRDPSDLVWFEVNIMQRAPPATEWDIINKSTQVYRYIDTDELAWIQASALVRPIPLEYIEPAKTLDKSYIYDQFPTEQRKMMLYYMKGPDGVPGLPMRFKLLWWHFDSSSLASLEWKQRRCPALNDEDLTSGFVSHLKPLIFDPFVSPLSYSHRHPQKHWNIRTWRLLLRNSVAPVNTLDFELDKLRHPPFDIITKEEIFLSSDCIRLIQVLLKEWVQACPEEMSPYEAKVYMDLHETFVTKAIGIIAKQKERAELAELADSSGSDASDLDEHMSFGGNDSDDYDGEVTEDEVV